MKVSELYEIPIEEAVEELKAKGAKRILLQLPDGLKKFSLQIAELLQYEGFEVVLSAGGCYGGCDVAVNEATAVRADAILHVGHLEFLKIREIPVVYAPLKVVRAPLEELASQIALLLPRGAVLGLVAQLEYVELLPELKRKLQSKGFRTLIAEKPLILGCDVRAAESIANKVDAIVVLGAGEFHALGVQRRVDVKVLLADCERCEVRGLASEVKRREALRWEAISKAKEARRFLVVTSVKLGQFKLGEALKAVKALERIGAKALLAVVDEISVERLYAFTWADAFIIAGCPRLVFDHLEIYGKPVVDVEDVKYIVEEEFGASAEQEGT